jgi:hypothetical protein
VSLRVPNPLLRRCAPALAALAAALVALVFAGCVPELTRASGRNPDLFNKPTDHLEGVSRGNLPEASPEVFVKQPQIKIKDLREPNASGSLFNVDDERNYLFASSAPAVVGRYLDIAVVYNAKGKDEAKKKPSGKDKGDKAADAATGDPELDELLKALPELAPPAGTDLTLVRRFKARIMHRYDNGDVLVMLERRSASGEQVNDLNLEARIPYDRLAAGDPLTTEDLQDVRFRETLDQEVVDRASSGWQDEYALRLSGFKEARSQYAQQLEDDRRKLAETEQKLDTRIKALGEEKKNVAKQRDDLAKAKTDHEQKVKSLEDTIKDQKAKIDEQVKALEDLGKPENKPGAKEGESSGK